MSHDNHEILDEDVRCIARIPLSLSLTSDAKRENGERERERVDQYQNDEKLKTSE